MENFIHNKAVQFAKQRIAVTFLVFSDPSMKLIGYYTLANKFVSVSGGLLSRTLQKKILKFSQYDGDMGRYLVSMPLISQLGRNFAYAGDKESIVGSRLLALACGRVMQAQRIISGKMAYIECGSNDKLYKFYSDNGFKMFGNKYKSYWTNTSGNGLVISLIRRGNTNIKADDGGFAGR